MTIPIVERDKMISGWLAQSASGARQSGCGRWELTLNNRGRAGAFASVEDDWLVFVLPLTGAIIPADEWSLLCRNADLAGLCKFVHSPGHSPRQLRADLPMDSQDRFARLPRRIKETLEDLEAAWEGLRDAPKSAAPAAERRPRKIHPGPEDAVNLADHLNGMDWPFVERAPSKYAVDLEVQGSFAQAIVEHQNDLVVSYMEAARFASLSAMQRAALGSFLLEVSGAVRMARASVVEAETAAVVRFEVRVAAPSPAELGHALAALSVAANLYGREAQCFENRQVAEIYRVANGHACVP